jgi:hypothetical protein
LRKGATFSSGNVGQAFSLDGSSGFIEIPDASALRPVSLTLEAWVAFDTAAGPRVVFAKPVGTGTSDSLLGRDTENGIPQFFLAGRIDEATIYSRPLSAAEITVLGGSDDLELGGNFDPIAIGIGDENKQVVAGSMAARAPDQPDVAGAKWSAQSRILVHSPGS